MTARRRNRSLIALALSVAILGLLAATSRSQVVSPVEGVHPTGQKTALSPVALVGLHELSRRSMPPLRSNRNLFKFRSSGNAVAASVPSVGPTDATPPSPVHPVPPSFNLIGIAESYGPGGVVRTAIITSAGELFLVKEGEYVVGDYRVVRIFTDAADLSSPSDDAPVRLVLK